MKKLRQFFLVLISVSLLTTSCKKDNVDEPWVDPVCEHEVLPMQGFSMNELFERFGPLSAIADAQFLRKVREEVYKVSIQGGDYIDGDNRCYSFTIDDWEVSIQFDEGGPYCAGLSYLGVTVFDEINMNRIDMISYAVISIGEKNNFDDPNGHVLPLVGEMRDGEKIASWQDFQFNYTIVHKGTSRTMSSAEMDSLGALRLLHEQAAMTVHAVPRPYLQNNTCVYNDHPSYNANLDFELRESGRDSNDVAVMAPATFDHFAQYWSNGQEDFFEVYQRILDSHGFDDIQLRGHPENYVYIFLCNRAVYRTNDPEFAESLGMYQPTPEQHQRLMQALAKQYMPKRRSTY